MLFNRKAEYHSDEAPAHPLGLDHGSPGRALTQSLIDASLAIVGDLQSEGDVQIDGHVCGNISCAQLVVGRGATITGTVVAKQAVVRGRVTGTIRANLVILQDTACVESEIVYNLLAIDDGATFEGVAHRRPDPLRDADAASSLAELQRMTKGTEAGRAGGSNGRHSKTEDRPANGSSNPSDG